MEMMMTIESEYLLRTTENFVCTESIDWDQQSIHCPLDCSYSYWIYVASLEKSKNCECPEPEGEPEPEPEPETEPD